MLPGPLESAAEGGVRPPLRRPWLSPRLVAAIAIPYGLVEVPLARLGYELTASAGAVVMDGELTLVVSELPRSVLIASVLMLLVPVLVAPWAVLAGIGICAAEGTGRPVSVPAAWWWALRRPGAVARLAGVLLLGAAGAGGLGLVLLFVMRTAPPAALFVVVGLVLITLTRPFCGLLGRAVARILVPADSTPCGRLAVPAERRGRPASEVLNVLVGWAVLQATLRAVWPDLSGWLADLVVSVGTFVVVAALVAAIVGDVFATRRDGTPTVALPGRVGRVRPGADGALVGAAVAAVVAGAVASPLAVAQNPSGLVRMSTTRTAEAMLSRADLMVVGDTVVLRRDESERVWACTEHGCHPEAVSATDTSVVAATSGSGQSVWSTQWRESDPQPSIAGGDEGVSFSLELTQRPAGGEGDSTESPEEPARTVLAETTLARWSRQTFNVDVAVASSGGLAVATAPGPPDQQAGLMVITCAGEDPAGLRCETHFGWLPPRVLTFHEPLRVAAADARTAYVAATHGDLSVLRPEVSLFVAADGVVTERRIAADREDRDRRVGTTFPSSTSVAVGPDGTVWMLYRMIGERDGTLVRCADRGCEEWTTIAVPGVTLARGALALDDTGRPMVVTADPDDSALLLWSCRDTWCSEAETVRLDRPVQDWRGRWTAPSITIDGDQPVILVPRDYDSGVLLRCEEARCGAA